MKKILIGLILSLSAFAACAENIDTSGLSAAQVAEIKSIAANKAAEAAKQKAEQGAATLTPKDPSTLATMAATWGQQAAVAAEGFAHALAIAAKELGITINEFLATPAGKLTAALIIWKVAGAAIVHMLYGIFFLTVGLSFSRMLYMRIFTKGYEKVEYKRFGGLWSGTKMVRIPKTISGLETDGEWLMLWVMIAMTVCTIVTGVGFF